MRTLHKYWTGSFRGRAINYSIFMFRNAKEVSTPGGLEPSRNQAVHDTGNRLQPEHRHENNHPRARHTLRPEILPRSGDLRSGTFFGRKRA